MRDVMTFAATADTLKRSVGWVKARCEDGTLATVEHGGRTWVRRDSVEEMVDRGGDRATSLHEDDEPRRKPGATLGSIGRACAYVAYNEPPIEERGTIARSMNATTGPSGGFLVPYQLATEVFDRARSYDGPLARCRFWMTTRKEFGVPYFDETSRATGSRWGGANARGGMGEEVSLGSIASQPSIGVADFNCNPLIAYSAPMSNDLLQDAEILEDVLGESSAKEIRYTVEGKILTGTGGGEPLGVIGADCTVAVAKESGQSAATINVTNVDKMWAALWGPSKRNAVWLCNDQTFTAIDSLAVTEAWPTAIYMPSGAYGNPWPLLKGRPLISQEQCPALGQQGDLILGDFSQYAVAFHKFAYDPVKGQEATPRPMEVSLATIDEVIEKTSSGHLFFDTDRSVFKFKTRYDGKPLWRTTVTPANGTGSLGPFVVLAVR